MKFHGGLDGKSFCQTMRVNQGGGDRGKVYTSANKALKNRSDLNCVYSALFKPNQTPFLSARFVVFFYEALIAPLISLNGFVCVLSGIFPFYSRQLNRDFIFAKLFEVKTSIININWIFSPSDEHFFQTSTNAQQSTLTYDLHDF